MSEPQHVRIGPWGLHAPDCPACQSTTGRAVRAQERLDVLRGAQAGALLDELKRRIGDLSMQNAELRSAAQTVEDKTEFHRITDNGRLNQIKNLERVRGNLEKRVRYFRERLTSMVGAEIPHAFARTDESLLNRVENRLKAFVDQVADLESTASVQSESLSKVALDHAQIFELVRNTLGVSTEGMSAFGAALRLATEYRTVRDLKDQYSDQLRELRDQLQDRDRVVKSLRERLRHARQDNGTMEALRKEVEELRTAQAPRWYQVGTSPEGLTLETSTAYQPPESVDVLHNAGEEVTWYLWLDRDGDVWCWSTGESRWYWYSKGTGRAHDDVVPSRPHGPYYPLGLVRPAFLVTRVENLAAVAIAEAKGYIWEDKDGDQWTWNTRHNSWTCDLAHPSARPSTIYGPYTRGERVSG